MPTQVSVPRRTLKRLYRLPVLGLLLFAQAVTAVMAAAPAEDYVYQVVKGDTVIGLSARLLNKPADWAAIVRHNRMRNANLVLPGQELRIPLPLLNSKLEPVTVTHVQGDVKASTGAGAPSSVLALGATLAEGAQVVTGKDGYVTLKLRDGSVVRVQSGTEMQVERQRNYPDVGILESVMKVISGRVESLVQKFRSGDTKETKQTRHSINTQLANLAVRGTEFRVTMDPKTTETRGEVLSGAVAVVADGSSAGAKRLDGGFGSVVDANKTVSDPVALLAAPDVAQLANLQERTLLRFRLPALDGARGYRAQVARDAEFNAVVAEIVSPSPELRVTNIDDGGYYLRVRGVDARGLEGRDATHAFKLKARPEPPAVSSPVPKGKVRALEVEFKWAENTEAATYHIQVAKDAAFKSLVFEDKGVKGPQAVAGKLALGEYFWRIASLRKDGDRGPYGDVASFGLFAPPAQPEPPKVGDGDISFRWAGETGQKFDFQLAADAKFSQPIVTRTLDKPEIDLPRPKPGEYFMRYRATDPDGFVGPYTAAQKFSVPLPPPCLRDSEGRCVSSTFGLVAPLN